MTLAKDHSLAPMADAIAGQRPLLSLDGAWDFQVEGEGDWRIARVPAPWQALFDDLRHASGTALYRKRFSVPAEWASKRVFLCFGAVNHLAEVHCDGRLVGTHEGGYLPFEFDLGSGLAGEHELTVRVVLPSSEADVYPDAPFHEVPHGKQSWYGPIGGIWQSVRLEARAVQHIQGCRITADPRTGNVHGLVRIAAETADRIVAEIEGPSGTIVAEQAAAPSTPDPTEIALRVEDPDLWSPDEPHLYRLTLRLVRDGVTVDRWSDTFGFRTIEARHGRLLPQRQAALSSRRPRSGLLPRRHLHAAVAGISRGSAPEGKAARAQLPAHPHQGAGSALLRGRRSPRHAHLDRIAELRLFHALRRAPRQGDPRRHPRPRLQSSLDHRLDDHQRGLGHRAAGGPGSPALALQDVCLDESSRPDAPRRRQFALPAELPRQERHQRLPLLPLPARTPGGMGRIDRRSSPALPPGPTARMATASRPARSRSSSPSSASGACPIPTG